MRFFNRRFLLSIVHWHGRSLFPIRRKQAGLVLTGLAFITALLAVQIHHNPAQAQDASSGPSFSDPYIPSTENTPGELYQPWNENPVDDSESSTSDQPCDDSSASLGELQSGLIQAASWIEKPQTPVSSLLHSLGPTLVAQFNASPFPEINERARSARVPILMYHDIIAEKEVFFDVTPEEFESHLQMIQQNGLTPISMDQLVHHLRTGLPLPEKPIMLTFDDGYRGHHEYVFPLLKQYGYPGLFAIYTYKVGRDYGRPGMTWDQVKEMAADPLVTIASHSITHPADLREVDDDQLRKEVEDSRKELEERLGMPITYFVYPEGKYDDRVAEATEKARYMAALTMDDEQNLMAGQSDDLFSIERIGQSQIATVIEEAWGGAPMRPWGSAFDFTAPITVNDAEVDDIPVTVISGGRPVTIHADSRYQVQEIIADTPIEAAVDGGFFSLEFLDSNQMIGPVMSQNNGEFVPGGRNDVPFIKGRPMVLISPTEVRFIPFDPDKHNTLEGVRAEMPGVTDMFVAAAWLVKNGEPQPPETFGSLFDYDAERHRAFWGINQQGQPAIGVSHEMVDSVHLGEILSSLDMQDAVMLDSGASTSLVYQGDSMVGYEPRPVPHVVGLLPTGASASSASSGSACLTANSALSSSSRF